MRLHRALPGATAPTRRPRTPPPSLGAGVGEDGEVAREIGDQLQLACTWNLDRPVRDLDVGETELDEPALVVVDAVLRVDDLEERPPDEDRLLAQHVELPLQVLRHGRGSPAELHDRDVLAGDLEDVLPRPRDEAF